VLDPERIVDLPESQHPNSGFEAGLVLTKRLIESKQRFSALMAFDDMSAFGAIRALSAAGIDVPGQCSVIGFDDIAPSSIATPALTTIRQPLGTMGTISVDIALQAIKAEETSNSVPAVHRRLAPELIARDSTRSLRENSSENSDVQGARTANRNLALGATEN
jgi:LacI family transcriptional regulator